MGSSRAFIAFWSKNRKHWRRKTKHKSNQHVRVPKGWTISFLMGGGGGGLCKSPKKYRACASGLKKISCRIVKKEKNIEQP